MQLRGDVRWWERHVAQQPEQCHPNGALVLLEEDSATVTELVRVRLISKGLETVVGLLVGEEEEQAQEFAMDAARGRHACRQESHL